MIMMPARKIKFDHYTNTNFIPIDRSTSCIVSVIYTPKNGQPSSGSFRASSEIRNEIFDENVKYSQFDSTSGKQTAVFIVPRTKKEDGLGCLDILSISKIADTEKFDVKVTSKEAVPIYISIIRKLQETQPFKN